jgi:hypothetical protein
VTAWDAQYRDQRIASRRRTWDILITSIPHRHRTLCELLAALDVQIQPGVGVRIWRDNLEHSYGEKCGQLTRSSPAEYVSFVDDDDMVAPDFVARVMDALRKEPDYVGFPVRYTQNGVPVVPVEHSLRHGGWGSADAGRVLVRDITQFNPIKRELALLGEWEGGNGAECRWGDGVRATGLCNREIWIPEPMYYYRENLNDTFKTVREPMPFSEIPALPSYPWLTVIGNVLGRS